MQELDLIKYIKVGHGEGSEIKKAIVADIFESLMGAIYLGTGLILVHGIRIPDAFFINNPAIKGSPLIVWVMLPIYLVVYFIIILIVELIRKKRNAQLND